MLFNIHTGRMRNKVSFYTKNGAGTDANGTPLGRVLVTTTWCEVQETSGSDTVAYGTTLTSSVITILMRNDPLVDNNQIVVWNDSDYRIQHIRRDPERRGMILTAEVIKK